MTHKLQKYFDSGIVQVTEFSSGAELTLAGLYEETELEDGW
jgi:hypothetical protein